MESATKRNPRPVTIRPACQAEMDEVRRLFSDYQEFLDIDLRFQDFDAELMALPGDYAPPRGALLMAWGKDDQGVPVAAGGVAMRPLHNGPAGVCEMKRLYVRDPWKGRGLGRQLAERIMAEARVLGYHRMVLDTLERLEGAKALYGKLGFSPIAPYYENPLADSVYLASRL